MRIFLIIAFVALLLCLGVVIYIGFDLHKNTVKMRRDCSLCALRKTADCPWSNCYLYDGHPYFKKIPRRSKNAKH